MKCDLNWDDSTAVLDDAVAEAGGFEERVDARSDAEVLTNTVVAANAGAVSVSAVAETVTPSSHKVGTNCSGEDDVRLEEELHDSVQLCSPTTGASPRLERPGHPEARYIHAGHPEASTREPHSYSEPDFVAHEPAAPDAYEPAVPAVPVESCAKMDSLDRFSSRGVEWLWPDVIPVGKLTLLTGEAGIGKSLVAADLMAAVCRGAARDGVDASGGEGELRSGGEGDGSDCVDEDGATDGLVSLETCGPSLVRGRETLAQRESESEDDTVPIPPPLHHSSTPPLTIAPSKPAVVLFSDNQGDWRDVLPAQIAEAGADLRRVFVFRSGAENLKTQKPGFKAARLRKILDLEKRESEVLRLRTLGTDVRLIVVDPIDCYLGAFRKGTDTLYAIELLAEMAERLAVAVLVVSESPTMKLGPGGFRKLATGNRDLSRIARAVWVLFKDIEAGNRRLMLPYKNRFCTNVDGFAFVVPNESKTPCGRKPEVLAGHPIFYNKDGICEEDSQWTGWDSWRNCIPFPGSCAGCAGGSRSRVTITFVL